MVSSECTRRSLTKEEGREELEMKEKATDEAKAVGYLGSWHSLMGEGS